MKMTNKEHDAHRKCSTKYVIDYVTPNGKGHIEVKTSFYDKYMKKFTKLFKDAVIIKMEEVTE